MSEHNPAFLQLLFRHSNMYCQLVKVVGSESIRHGCQLQLVFICDVARHPTELEQQDVTLCLSLNQQLRWLHGKLTQTEQNKHLTHSTLVDLSWQLSSQKHSRVFNQQTLQEIIEIIVTPYVLPYLKLMNLAQLPTTRLHAVQYQESDWQFISRLCQQQQIIQYIRYDSYFSYWYFTTKISQLEKNNLANTKTSSTYRLTPIPKLEIKSRTEDTQLLLGQQVINNEEKQPLLITRIHHHAYDERGFAAGHTTPHRIDYHNIITLHTAPDFIAQTHPTPQAIGLQQATVVRTQTKPSQHTQLQIKHPWNEHALPDDQLPWSRIGSMTCDQQQLHLNPKLGDNSWLTFVNNQVTMPWVFRYQQSSSKRQITSKWCWQTDSSIMQMRYPEKGRALLQWQTHQDGALLCQQTWKLHAGNKLIQHYKHLVTIKVNQGSYRLRARQITLVTDQSKIRLTPHGITLSAKRIDLS